VSSFIQRSFAGGELAPELHARVDQVKYATGLKTLRNMLVMKSGGVTSRSGTQYLGEVHDSTIRGRLIPWVFNADQTYVLEFGHQILRFWKNGVRIAPSSSAWTTATNYDQGDTVTSGGIHYYAKIAHLSSGANTPPNATFWHPMPAGILEFPVFFTSPNLQFIRYAQSADVLTLVDGTTWPQELRRFSDTKWTMQLASLSAQVGQPGNISSVSGTAGALSFTYKVTSVDSDRNEESLPKSFTQGALSAPTTGTPITVAWTTSSDPNVDYYNVYRELNGVAGFIGVATLAIRQTWATTPRC
jgi:hypothetical protein